jgi:hypothetical protein
MLVGLGVASWSLGGQIMLLYYVIWSSSTMFFWMACMEAYSQYYVWTKVLYLCDGTHGHGFVYGHDFFFLYLKGIQTTMNCIGMGSTKTGRMQKKK